MNNLIQNNVTEKLARDETVLSFQVRLVQSVEVAQLAHTCGYDTMYVDVEHSSFSLHDTSQICMAAIAVGITPFVRVPAYGPEYVSRYLDAGAMGIIAPHVNTREEAQMIVRSAKFPPYGDRSVTFGLPHLKFQNVPHAQARELMNANTTVLTMLESPEAIENANEIAAVEGVDILFIGSNDLCAQMGIHGQFHHPKVREAFEHTIAVARKHGKHVGIGGLSGEPELLADFIGLGARYVSAGNDLLYLMTSARARCDQLKKVISEGVSYKGTKQ